MTVTFSLVSEPTGAFRLSPTCLHADTKKARNAASKLRTVIHPTYETAVEALLAHKATCEDCDTYGCFTESIHDTEALLPGIATEDLEINLANTNAHQVATVCGFSLADDDGCHEGRMSADIFAGHVLMALALLDSEVGVSDAGIEAVETRRENGPAVVDCGLRPGYYAETLGRLADLAAHAQRLGRDIWWA